MSHEKKELPQNPVSISDQIQNLHIYLLNFENIYNVQTHENELRQMLSNRAAGMIKILSELIVEFNK